MKTICVKCNRAMIKEFAGVLVAELYMDDREIYKLWYADLFRCPICRTEVISDFAEKPFWNCHEKDRDQQKNLAIKTARVKEQYFVIKEGGGMKRENITMEKISIGFYPNEIVSLINHLDNAARGFYDERGSELQYHVDVLGFFLKSELKKHGYEIVGTIYKNKAIKI